ncbi:MAG: hypothetical protein IT581_03395 [Verrucomicrobiales bacterium]|nr:hypothetical protein [Verrucomicrobiales bacterium]
MVTGLGRLLLFSFLELLQCLVLHGEPLSYRGQLSDSGQPTNGHYDMEFRLFDTAETGSGTQQGAPFALGDVGVTNGAFTVTLDFSPTLFEGRPRYLEISLKPAGEPGAFHLLNPRQRLTSLPYAIHSVSAEQLAGIAATNFLRADAAGRVAIGRTAPLPDFSLDVAGPTLLEPGGSGGGFISFHTPNFETGMTINGNGNQRADIRFDGSTLKLLASDSAGPPPNENGLTIGTNGSVGIGTTHPAPGVRLQVEGATLVNPGGSGGAIQLGSPNAETGVTILGANRADLRFDGGTLTLAAAPGRTPPSAASGVAIRTSGKVGIGTKDPVAKLHVEEPTPNTAAVYGHASGPGGVGVYGESANGPAVVAKGDAVQSLDRGGFVKAMVFVNPFLPAADYVVRCFNATQTGSATSSAPCGIQVTRIRAGLYTVDFGFPVEDRFFSLTSRSTSGGEYGLATGTINIVEGSKVSVSFSRIDDGQNLDDCQFYLIVY